MSLIGREDEIRQLEEAASSNYPEFVVIYGRRRVGKTFLVNQVFKDRFAFSHAGLSPAELQQLKEKNKSKTILDLQLEHFYYSLIEFGYKGKKAPKNWLEAFHFLSLLLAEKKEDSEKQIVFLDELAWLDTPKSYFITAFESFCNGYASRENVLLIGAGSAISWILRKLLKAHGGLYNRVTKEILLAPFSLYETEKLLEEKHVNYSRYDIARTYMVFGGIPHYLHLIDGRYSLSENIDRLFYHKKGALKEEFERLFSSSFDNAKVTSDIVKALYTRQIGMTREEISEAIQKKDGEVLTEGIKALEISGFIVKYVPLQSKKREQYYKLIDPFCLFYLHFVEGKTTLDEHFYTDNEGDNRMHVWKGLSFENLCYNHLDQIKNALQIRGVSTSRFSFVMKGSEDEKGAQIDLVLERKDNVVNLCEMKFYADLYHAEEEDDLNLRRKKTVLSSFLKKKQTIQTVLITTFGLAKGKYQWLYQNVVTLSDLFEKA